MKMTMTSQRIMMQSAGGAVICKTSWFLSPWSLWSLVEFLASHGWEWNHFWPSKKD